MIKSFACKYTAALFEGTRVAKFSNIETVAIRKLALIHGACSLDDLRAPPGNRLEALAGNRQGRFSIRVNDQWRICFIWNSGHAEMVEIVDYH
ncbi:type II toxin-antitoxin system RelE/ParE family toxin [Pusillimonas sp. NJUB218]|uniref:type II toxin-antitoxin system RelE/ParE family toxin n=1 Tax=Pusillimonas sp. NJUB218 TaxID=2023230 RepID=UPI000F4CAE62|nr:type II toxin-antitoxin system RelE/ParE family toxin [Pusillimonas sp. NJUB218]ROT44044.1 excinuclease ABC subunit A [Pusillimonas sp. NJUB218]